MFKITSRIIVSYLEDFLSLGGIQHLSVGILSYRFGIFFDIILHLFHTLVTNNMYILPYITYIHTFIFIPDFKSPRSLFSDIPFEHDRH